MTQFCFLIFYSRKKASIKGDKISMPKALEHYIAVTDYKKQEKGEITLKVGMLVEIVEKTETGKLCRLCSEEYLVFLLKKMV